MTKNLSADFVEDNYCNGYVCMHAGQTFSSSCLKEQIRSRVLSEYVPVKRSQSQNQLLSGGLLKMSGCSQSTRNTDAKDTQNFEFVGTIQANEFG